MLHQSRRNFIKTCGAVSAGFLGLHGLIARNANASPRPTQIAEGYGRLLPDPHGVLDLPANFTYRVISAAGNTMDDGLRLPGLPDGMATFFGPDGRTILIRNHEIELGPATLGAFGDKNENLQKISANMVYDSGFQKTPSLGGTTTVIFDTISGTIERQWLSLAGTFRNCAGGPTPWKSWITCEEATVLAGAECERDHGYNFEVHASTEMGLMDSVPLKAMGRFRHEAIAVNPGTGVIYQTEDLKDGGIYRFIPTVPTKPAEGGVLQALGVVGRDKLITNNWDDPDSVVRGEAMPVRWVNLTDVESPNDDLRKQAFDKGAAQFARGEGMWAGNDAIYFACTDGGPAKAGQIFRYTPSPAEGTLSESEHPGTLELFIEPNDTGLVDMADNLTVAPWGDLIVCENGTGENFLVGVTLRGDIYKFARNVLSESEFAGSTFSPDGSTLFVNIQVSGLTLAITGPWRERIA